MIAFNTRCRALLCTLAIAAFGGPAIACLEIPPVPPDIWIVVTGPNDADIIIHDFHTYGSTAGADYCACALNIPALYGTVVSATIVDANTGIPLPGFSFGGDPDTEAGFQAAAPLTPPDFWTGFSSAVSSTIAAGTPVDIVFHVVSPDRPFDWNGLADELADGTPVLATDAADPDGTPTGAHQSIQPAGAVGVEVMFSGLPNRPMGQATLTRSGGSLVVSNLGSSGKDGVSFVDPPDTQGASILLGPETCPTGPPAPGRGIGLRQINVDSFFDISYDITISDTWQAAVSSSQTPACMQVQVYHQGQLQLDQCVPAGQPLIDMPADVCPSALSWLHLPTPRMRLVLDQPAPIQVGGAPAPVDGDELHIFDPAFAPSPPQLTELYGVSPPDSFFDIWIELETTQMFDNQHHTLGEAVYQNSGGHLVVSNIGSSGQDGVRSLPPDFGNQFRVDSFFDIFTELVLDPDPAGDASSGAYLDYSATGPLHGGGEAPLGNLRVTKFGTAHRVTSDFSPVGSTTTRVEVYNGGALVETFSGLSGPLVDYFEWPQSTGKLSSGWPPVLSCFVQTWSTPLQIHVHAFPDGRGVGTTVMGDEVRFLAEGGTPVDGVSSMSVQGSGYPSITIAGQSSSGPTDTDGDGVPDAVDNCVLVANPSQCDTNGDGFGNHCDADIDNNNSVNSFDLTAFRGSFGSTSGGDADLNCDGSVNSFDLGIMRQFFGLPPGPSGH